MKHRRARLCEPVLKGTAANGTCGASNDRSDAGRTAEYECFGEECRADFNSGAAAAATRALISEKTVQSLELSDAMGGQYPDPPGFASADPDVMRTRR